MAPKEKKPPKSWSNTRPLDWGGVATPQMAAPPEVQNPLLQPEEFDVTAPVTGRPDVPELEEEIPQSVRDNSIIGGFMNIMDNITPDDMGGLVRGTSGWLGEVPLYRETVGTALGVPLSAAESVINAVNWGSEQMNHLGAALFSAFPGGIQTLTWDESQDISLGQVATANAAINNSRGIGGWLINAATLQIPFAAATAIGKSQDPDNILYSPQFDILDEEDRAKAFESGGMGQITSGFADAIWLVAADPTIIGGKASNIIRLGTKAGEFGGITNQALRTTEQVRRWSTDVRQQGELIQELGIEGARSSGRLTAQGEYLIAAMEGKADDLVEHTWVKSSSNQRETRALLGMTSTDDPVGASLVAGAMGGSSEAWAALRQHDADMYARTAESFGVNVFAPVGDRTRNILGDVQLTDDQIRLQDDINIERLAQRPDLLPEFRDIKDIDPTEIAAGQMINRGGARFGPRTVRAKNAWGAGKARTQFQNNAFEKSPSIVATNAKGHYVYDFIYGVSGSMPLRVVRWLGQGTPTGVIQIKNGTNANMVLRDYTSWLRKSPIDPAQASNYLNRFAAARTPDQRSAILMESEAEAARLIAAKHGVSAAAAQKAYDSYAAKRAAYMDTVKKSETKFAKDPDTGQPVKVPQFYAEIDPAYAMLDTKVFNRVIGGNASWLKTWEDATTIGDELNKYWKLSVLLRLGYTQRNLAEGALRSFAVLGLIAANPAAVGRIPGNAYNYVGARRALKKSRIQERALMTSYENLMDARRTLDEALQVSRYDEMMELRRQADELYREIQRIRGRAPAGAQIPAKPLTKEQQKRIANLDNKRRRLIQKSIMIRNNFYEPMIDELDQIRGTIRGIQNQIDEVGTQLQALTAVAREKNALRKRGGYAENIVGGQRLQGAFQGSEGAMAAINSSADRTTYMSIDLAYNSRIRAYENSPDFPEIDPKKISPKQLPRYFDELTLRINNRIINDPIGRLMISGESDGFIKSWLMSDAGKSYRQAMSLKNRPLNTEQEVDAYIVELRKRIDNEMPADTNLRELAMQGELTPGEVAAAFRGKELPIIYGRIDDDIPTNLAVRGKRGLDTLSDKIMRGIGSFPETKLLRHPFYNRVYMDRQAQLWRLAAEQGADMSSNIVKNRINRSSHDFALKATTQTMYTIEELSNAAVMLRYISPFFPAFENSLRTWGRIAWNNPAVIGEGNLLWNIPNNLGWVVDEDGNKVDRSNFLIDENHFIQWPEPVANTLLKQFGPFTAGESLRSRQHGLNIIFQGGQWWFPGAGPAISLPLAYVLRGKPEDAEILRNTVGEEVFMQLVPSGNPNADLVDAILPTWGRRLKQMWSGDSSDQAFLYNWNQIIEDEYINAQIEGRPFTEKDAERVKQKADAFWRWQLVSAVVMPFQSSIASKFQVQRDKWNQLIDNQALSYTDKIKAFNEEFPEFGDALMAITRSGSYTETKLQPNLMTWQRIYKNKDLVDNLYAIDPELVGMFGNMGSFEDPFSRAVYGEFGKMTVGPNDARVRRMMKPDEIIRNNQIKDGWTEFWRVKDYAEDKAEQLGYSSLQVKEAENLRNAIDEAAMKLEERYPAWGEERRLYMDKLPAFIQGARLIVQNAELVDEDTTVAALSDYLVVRERVADALANTDNKEEREQIRLIGYEAAWKLRKQDIGFADFYDQYLYRDDFRKI